MSRLIELFLYVLKLVSLQSESPLLLMSADEHVPEIFCSGTLFPITCAQYDTTDPNQVLERLLTIGNDLVFLSHGNHTLLVTEMGKGPRPMLFSRTRMWLMPLEYSSRVALRLDSRVYFYHGSPSGNFTVSEGLAIGRESKVEMTKLFDWSPETKQYLNVFEKKSVLRRRSNLNGAVLKSYFGVDNYPFVKYIKDGSGAIVKTVGYYADILSYLEDGLNLTFDSTASQEGWGVRTKNGTWDGLMGKLVGNKIDLSPNFGMSLQRQEAIDFCWPTYTKKFTLITARATRPKIDMWAYVQIFPLSAWACIIALTFSSAAIFSLVGNQPLVQGMAMVFRHQLQMDYDLPLPRAAAKVSSINYVINFFLALSPLSSLKTDLYCKFLATSLTLSSFP